MIMQRYFDQADFGVSMALVLAKCIGGGYSITAVLGRLGMTAHHEKMSLEQPLVTCYASEVKRMQQV